MQSEHAGRGTPSFGECSGAGAGLVQITPETTVRVIRQVATPRCDFRSEHRFGEGSTRRTHCSRFFIFLFFDLEFFGRNFLCRRPESDTRPCLRPSFSKSAPTIPAKLYQCDEVANVCTCAKSQEIRLIKFFAACTLLFLDQCYGLTLQLFNAWLEIVQTRRVCC
jgi:hypothetical protein